MYCAGRDAINALKESNLAFKWEVASVSFQVLLWMKGKARDTWKETEIIHIIIKF